MSQRALTIADKQLAGKLLLLVFGMFAFGFAMVPLYNVFCDLTGLNGSVGVEAAVGLDYPIDHTRQVTVEFVTATNETTPIEFSAEKSALNVLPGEYYTVYFTARNLNAAPLTGQAIPSLSPGLAAKYLKKVECFCFVQQKFAAHETKRMPVRFVLDPALPAEYKNLTLAYTFFASSDSE